MRDVNRIIPFCTKFAKLWESYFPDLRFGQLICGFIAWMNSDCFYLEEKDYLAKFEEYCKSYGKRQDYIRRNKYNE